MLGSRTTLVGAGRSNAGRPKTPIRLLASLLYCRRRSKSEPPRRPTIEPGVEADVEMVGCG